MVFDVTPPPPGWTNPTKPSILNLHSFPGYEAKLIHILLGATDIVHTPTGTVTNQKINFGVLGTTPANRSSRGLSTALKAQTLGISDLNAYLARNLAQTGFFEELFDEYARYFFHTNNGQHVQAFLHIYRILERVSYSLPIAYAAKSHNFKGTFGLLRDYLTSPKDGELKFFNEFVAQAIPASSLNTAIKLDISSNVAANQGKHFRTLLSSIKSSNIQAQSPGMWIEVQYRHLFSILINLRNRYFHFMSGPHDNLTGADLPDPDEFFESINPVFVNWLSYIFFRVLEIRV